MNKSFILFAFLALLIVSCSVTHEIEVNITTTDQTLRTLYYQPGNQYIFSIFNTVQGSTLLVYSTTFTGVEAGEKIIDPNIPTGDCFRPQLEVRDAAGTPILIGSFVPGPNDDITSDCAPSFSIYGGEIITVILQLSTP